jgi:hypothetical protein
MGGSDAVLANAIAAVDKANAAYLNSRVSVQLNTLAVLEAVGYTSQGFSADLNAVTNGNVPSVAQWRQQVCASVSARCQAMCAQCTVPATRVHLLCRLATPALAVQQAAVAHGLAVRAPVCLQYNADIVALITERTGSCGIGWLIKDPSVAAQAAYGYNVVSYACWNGEASARWSSLCVCCAPRQCCLWALAAGWQALATGPA